MRAPFDTGRFFATTLAASLVAGCSGGGRRAALRRRFERRRRQPRPQRPQDPPLRLPRTNAPTASATSAGVGAAIVPANVGINVEGVVRDYSRRATVRRCDAASAAVGQSIDAVRSGGSASGPHRCVGGRRSMPASSCCAASAPNRRNPQTHGVATRDREPINSREAPGRTRSDSRRPDSARVCRSLRSRGRCPATKRSFGRRRSTYRSRPPYC